ncbi:MAG: OmpA family protein, partial [Gemmatimonadales bacterium]
MLINAGSCLRRPLRALRVAAGVCAGIFGAVPLARAQTPMGTVIPNTARVTFIGASGQPDSLTSPTVTVTVGQLADVALVPPQSVTTDPGTTVVLAHTLTNTGNGPDRFTLAILDGLGRSAHVYVDVNGDGLLDAGDTAVTAPIPLAMQQSVRFLVVVVVPPGRTQRGTTDPVLVTATSTADPTKTDAVTDHTAVRDAGIAVALTKSVDRASATTGDTLTYTLSFTASGSNAATGLTFTDPLPSGLTFVPGSVRTGGQPPSGTDTAAYDAATRTLRVGLGDVTGGTTGSVTFRAVMGALAQVTNVASAAYGTPVGPDTVASSTATTGLVLPDVHVDKTLAGRSTVQVGDTLTYRIHVENRSSAVPVWSLVVADTLPAGLEFVAARPAAQVDGQLVRWTFASLGTSSDARVEIDVRVTHNTVDTVRLTNVATAAATNAAAVAASAAAITVVNLGGATLSLEKSAGVLEAGLGETAPFALTVRNTGPVPLSDIRVYDRLPSQLRLVPRSAAGADSTVVRDSGVVFFVAGPLAAGARTIVRYTTSVVAGSRDLLLNTAVATAFADVARSATATAFVRVRLGSPMETRAAIGKVWVDENDDGEQEPGEPGVAGVDVWTQDGDVATTDAEGRFSFRNLPTGRHAFRMDLSTVPADVRPAADAEADLEVRDGDGWTTPRVVFRLLPRAGRVRAVRVPLPWQFTARAARLPRPDTTITDTVACPASTPVRAAAPAAQVAPVILRGVNFATARATLLPASRAVLDRAVAMVRAVPGARVEIDGHTDSAGTRTGNLRLSLARARAVVAYLARHGIPARQLSAAGFGFDRPIAANGTAEGRALNRRVEMRFLVERSAAAPRTDSIAAPAAACTAARVVRDTTRALVEYAVRIDNPYDAPVRGLGVRFAQPLDSAAASADTLRTAPAGQEIAVAEIAPHGHAVVTAWSSHPSDSAEVELRGPAADRERLVAAVSVAPHPAIGRNLRLVLDSLPRADALGATGTAELLVAPRAAGWPDVTLALPDGWRLVEGDAPATAGDPAQAAPAVEPVTPGHGVSSVRPPSAPDTGSVAAHAATTTTAEPWAYPRAAAHATIRDRSGRELLLWHAADKWTPIVVTVEPVRASAGPDSLRIAPLRTTAERETERRRGFVAGPGVEIFAPTDGTVLATDRLWIGVRGEPGRAVTLLDGDSVLGRSDLRGDGVQDFVNVRLAAGPHRLRVRMDNSWG